MPASASCALTTSASCTPKGVLTIVSVNSNPFGWPPSTSIALALARSRLTDLMVSSYAQLEGEIGPLAGTPTPRYTPLTIASMSRAYVTAWRNALLSNGGFVVLSMYQNAASDGTSITTRLLSALAIGT